MLFSPPSHIYQLQSKSNKKSNEPSEAKKKRLLAAAEAEADEALALAGKRAKLSEAQVAPDDLTGALIVGGCCLPKCPLHHCQPMSVGKALCQI